MIKSLRTIIAVVLFLVPIIFISCFFLYPVAAILWNGLQSQDHLNQLTGFVQVPNTSLSPAAIVLYQHEMDCVGTTTSISSNAPVPNAVSAAKPVYNQCGELIGYIGSVVKNTAAPASIMLL